MTNETTVKMTFSPEIIDRTKAEEVNVNLEFNAPSVKKEYWCECVVTVKAPLSLSHDAPLEKGQHKVGILGPKNKTIMKQIKLFSVPSMHSIDYLVTVTTFLYDEEGTIADRHDTSEVIKVGVTKVHTAKK
jgi:hypothetical protein